MYAYVLCRLDIAYAITTLAKFSIAPNIEHYRALKRLAVYLRQTIDWGIIFWRPTPNPDLPRVPFRLVVADPTLPVVPFPSSYFEPGTYVDASLGNCPLKMASTTGYTSTMAGGAVAHRSKTQPITAQNISEA